MFSLTRKRSLVFLLVIGGIMLIVRHFWQQALAQNVSITANPELSTPLMVTVYYEPLCPDSKHFITKQLLPTYEKLHSLIRVVMVPYGKATTYTNPDGSYRFDCQHGPIECEANILHACTIEMLDDLNTQLQVVGCMIANNQFPKESMAKCAKEFDIRNLDFIEKCSKSKHGAELLKLNGDATQALRPPVTFIPTITLDGSQASQAAILKNLTAEICKIFNKHQVAQSLCSSSI